MSEFYFWACPLATLGKYLCIIFSTPPRPTASSLQLPPPSANPHPHNNDAASTPPSHDATPSLSSSSEDYNTLTNAHNTYETPANDERNCAMRGALRCWAESRTSGCAFGSLNLFVWCQVDEYWCGHVCKYTAKTLTSRRIHLR